MDRNPDNPIIGARAFSSEPGRVAELSAAFVEGVHAAGQLATAKHFPGHGGTEGDSHAELPTVADDRATLDATDLVPYRAVIDAGVDLVMTAHVVYPALDPDNPATRSPKILRGLLRDELGSRASWSRTACRWPGEGGGRVRGRAGGDAGRGRRPTCSSTPWTPRP